MSDEQPNYVYEALCREHFRVSDEVDTLQTQARELWSKASALAERRDALRVAAEAARDR